MLHTRSSKPSGIGREDRPQAISQLLREARSIRHDAPNGCHVSPKRDDIFQWVAVLEGPADTVYDGGTFFCNINFTMSYPMQPPKVEFLTRIYHCNVNAQGEVCIDILNEKWQSTMTVRTVMLALMSLMYNCNTGWCFRSENIKNKGWHFPIHSRAAMDSPLEPVHSLRQ
ncbi:unnamed protein product [Heligmosomoides polygyrus]|uniref:UBIQUITIN_CONJUGAT_2 domain-containing protein n=1 Tax=Heligmosomoides polygyrus TaxID=6339 RepID=A0A183FI67_HELPZ|nr:unnamed protein product [Heligmosomoides polygyrus]